MKEPSIRFIAWEVRAVLDGRKTQTRRVVKHIENRWEVDDSDGYMWPYWPCYVYGQPQPVKMPCPYGEPGYRLWVRETWAPMDGEGGQVPAIYRADYTGPERWKWKSSIHMPRWASRITLEVKAVRCERLQDITPSDAKSEGAPELSGMLEYHERGEQCYVDWFRELWDSINAKCGFPWESNPWVWVVEFEPIERNV